MMGVMKEGEMRKLKLKMVSSVEVCPVCVGLPAICRSFVGRAFTYAAIGEFSC
jgi:hypothetical protein